MTTKIVKVVAATYHMPNGITYTTGDAVAMTATQFAAIPTGDFPSKVVDVTTSGVPATTPAVTLVNGRSGSVDVSDLFAAHGAMPWARGQIVLILDDVRISQYQIALPAIEALTGNQKVTLACNSGAIGATGSNMTPVQLIDAANRGHEIACHSQTHADMTTLTATQRTAEWDTAKATIEGYIGAGTVKSWVYPFNTSNDATNIEAYLRYDRVFIGTGGGYVRPMERGSLTSGRFGWNSLTHQQALTLVRQVAAQPATLVIYTHDVDGSNPTGGVTQAEFQALVTLAASLGLPFVTAARGVPAHLAVHDGGFEDSTLANWSLVTTGAGTITSDVDTPSTGLGGVRSLHIVGDNTGTQNATSVHYLPILRPTDQYTVSARARHNRVAGTGGTALIVKEYDMYGTQTAQTNGATSITGAGSQPWQQLIAQFTPQATSRTFRVICNQSAMQGDSWFDHVHAGPTRDGIFG